MLFQSKTVKPFILTCLFSLIPLAQATDIETVTVTTSRTPIERIKTGSSITVITKKEILQGQAKTVAELLRSVPGMQVNQQGARGALTQVRVRGAEANHVLVLIDGIEVNDISQGSEFNFAHLQTDQIERIEVVRGPQSALWGSDALAGVINVITTKDNHDGSNFSLITELGSFNSMKSGLSYIHGSEKLQFKTSLIHFSTDGTNISELGSEDDGYKNTNFTLNTKYSISDQASISAVLRHNDSSTDFDAVDFFVTGLPVDANNQTDAKQIYARVGLDISSLQGKLDQHFSFSRTDTDNETDTGGLQNSISRGVKDQFQYLGNLSLEKQTISFIAEFETEDYEQRGLDQGFGNPNRDLDTNNNSAAIEYRFNGEDWHISASLRQDHNSDFDDATSYRISANWLTPIENLHAYSSFGRATKNPSFTERFGFFDTFVGNPNLEPELSDSWEIGLKFNKGTFNTSLSYFNSELENEINGFVFDPSTFAFTAKNRSEDSKRQGAEIELKWTAFERLSLNAAYTYLDSSFEAAGGAEIDEVRRPRHIASFGGNYAWDKANLNFSVNYNGRQKDDFFPPFPASPERVDLGAYTLVNLAGSYQLTDKLQLNARIENAFDDDYEEVFGYQSPGLAAYTGLRLNW